MVQESAYHTKLSMHYLILMFYSSLTDTADAN